MKITTKKVEKHVSLATKYIDDGKFKKAEKILKKAVIMDSYYAPIYRELGLAYFHQYRFQEAISEYKRALSINEEDPELHYRLGSVYYYQTKIDKAIKEFERCLQIDNKFVKAYYYLSIIYEAKGDSKKALELMHQAVNIAPEVEFERLQPGKVKIKKSETLTIDYLLTSILDTIKIYLQDIFSSKRFREVVKEGKKITKKATFEDYYQAGIDLKELNNYKRAELEFKKALRIRPHDVNCINELGLVYFYQNKFVQAENQFKKAIEFQPKFALSYYHLGCLYYQHKLLDEAIDYFNKAIELDKELAPAYYSLGLAYEKKGKTKEAFDFMEKAVKLVPDVRMLVPRYEEVKREEVEAMFKGRGWLLSLFKLFYLTLLHIPLSIFDSMLTKFYDKERTLLYRIISSINNRLKAHIAKLER